MKNQSILIGALTITAILMGVILLSSQQQPAQAMMTASAGDYTLVTVGPGGEETLTVVDNGTQRVLIYQLNNATKELEVLAGLTQAEFTKAFTKPSVKP